MQLRTVQHRPIVAGGMRIIPESQALTGSLPFGGLCFCWHRPTAVVVEQDGRPVQRVPIVDLSRAIQLGLLLVTLLLSAVCVSIVSERERP